ncbi:hypothetical protein HpBGD15_07280 [Helicobacter pylori]
MAKIKKSNPPPKKRKFKKSFKKKGFKIKSSKKGFKKKKKSFKRNPLKKKDFKKNPPKKRVQRGSFTKSQTSVSEHIIQIHAIEPSVFEFSPHKGIVIGVDGRDFKP